MVVQSGSAVVQSWGGVWSPERGCPPRLLQLLLTPARPGFHLRPGDLPTDPFLLQ